MRIISLILVWGVLFLNSATSKNYEYKQYIEDNNIEPLIRSSEEIQVDIIEFSSFSCLQYIVCIRNFSMLPSLGKVLPKQVLN